LNEKIFTAANENEGVSVLKNDPDVIVFTIRGSTEVRFMTKFLMTPFDRFQLGIKLELNSKPIELTNEDRAKLSHEH
jgi:hypothetical protein